MSEFSANSLAEGRGHKIDVSIHTFKALRKDILPMPYFSLDVRVFCKHVSGRRGMALGAYCKEADGLEKDHPLNAK